MPVVFIVHGTPAPQGSKRAFRNQHTGRIAMVESSSKVKPWRQAVKFAWAELGREGVSFPAPAAVHAYVAFYLPRPQGHFGTGKNAGVIKDSAPRHPAGKPDIDKLLRSTLDGIGEAGAWTDDAQVVTAIAE